MGYKLIVSEQFDAEMQSIYKYIADDLHQRQAARNLYKKVKRSINDVLMFPEMFPNHSIRKQFRFFTVGNYVVFYLIIKETNTVFVASIVYGHKLS